MQHTPPKDDKAPSDTELALIGSEAQTEWAGRIRACVDSEFDRVVAAFQVVANEQDAAGRASTAAIIAIAEDIRNTVMRNQQAGYFIHNWQDLSDQVRKMIFADPRYQALRKTKSNQSRESAEASI